MAIKSASPKGTSIGIQPSNQQDVPTAGQSKLQESSKGNLTKGDEVGIGSNSTDILLNADLEAALAVRGLSTLRPELIGSFEFIPPLSSPYGDPDEVTSTSSGELFDLQAQLKNMRYTETLEFLRQELGIRPSNRRKDRRTGLTSSKANAVNFLDEYKREMTGAADIVNWLTTTYNAITIMLEAMDFKNTLTEGDIQSSGGIKNATEFRGTYIDVYHHQYNLQEFLRYRNNIPYSWWESTNTTTLVCQLAVLIVGFLSRPSSGYPTPDKNKIYDTGSANAVDNNDSIPNSQKFDKGQILGAFTRDSAGVGIQNATAAALESIAKISWSNANGTPFISGASAGAYNDYFTEGDFYAMQNLIEMESGDGVSYKTGAWLGNMLKYIARDAMATVALQSGAYEDAGITSDQQSVNLDKKFKKVLGIAFRVNRKLGAINPDGIQNSVIGRLCPKNKDDGRGKIETFTIASSDLDNDDVQPARTGKSYFADEIVTSEIGDTTRRLQELSDDMTSAKQKLKALLDNTINIKKVRTGNSSTLTLADWWQMPPGHGDASSYLNAADLSWYVAAACAEDYRVAATMLHSLQSHAIPYLIAAACATDQELSWHLFKFMVTTCAHNDNNASDDELETAIERVADNLLEKYGGLTGEDNPSGNNQSGHSTGGRSEYAFGAGYLGDWRSTSPPGSCPSSHVAVELIDEYSLTYEEIFEALQVQTNLNGNGWTAMGGIFSGPYRGVMHFLTRVYESYEKPAFAVMPTNARSPFVSGGTGTHNIYPEGMYAVAALWAICNFTQFSSVIVPGESEWSGGPYPV